MCLRSSGKTLLVRTRPPLATRLMLLIRLEGCLNLALEVLQTIMLHLQPVGCLAAPAPGSCLVVKVYPVDRVDPVAAAVPCRPPHLARAVL